MVQIFPRSNENAPVTFEIRAKAVVGRSSRAEVQIADARVSRRHAELGRDANGLRVRDLDSRHGTFVDGAPVKAAGALAPFGAVLRFGDTLFLTVKDVSLHAGAPHRLAASFLGTARDVIAGPTLLRVWEQASRAAALRHPVLIVGESGSGKEAIARLLHANGQKGAPFVALNVAAVPEGLFESELFGHVRGAFTGATATRAGAFREASGGVLFLDEIGELRLDLQAKLLRAIDQRSVRPVGAHEELSADARVVGATNHDLEDAVAKGSFRLDLYHRLAGIVIRVPPLRERRDEILLLSVAILESESPALRLGADAAACLASGHWPGNARELHHALGRASLNALAAGRDQIEAADLPEVATEPANEAMTAERVQAVMRSVGGNATLTARRLGVSRATLYTLFRRLGLNPRELRAEP